jgi:hypothetical protein
VGAGPFGLQGSGLRVDLAQISHNESPGGAAERSPARQCWELQEFAGEPQGGRYTVVEADCSVDSFAPPGLGRFKDRFPRASARGYDLSRLRRCPL